MFAIVYPALYPTVAYPTALWNVVSDWLTFGFTSMTVHAMGAK